MKYNSSSSIGISISRYNVSQKKKTAFDSHQVNKEKKTSKTSLFFLVQLSEVDSQKYNTLIEYLNEAS